MVFGRASLTDEKPKKTYFNFTKDKRSFVLRVLPPFGSLKNDPLGWAKYWPVHFGYTDTKGRIRPFASPFRKRDKTVLVRDPALERLERWQVALHTASPEERAEIEKNLSRFYLSKRWYLNVVDLEGNIGLFSIPHKMMVALEAELKRLKQEGEDALSLEEGLFLEFSKEGVGRDTVHKVQVYLENTEVNGRKVKVAKRHTIDDAFAARAAKECFDLSKLYVTPTPEEIQAIINDESGKTLEAVLAKYMSSDGAETLFSADELNMSKEVLSNAGSVSSTAESSVIDYDEILSEVRGG